MEAHCLHSLQVCASHVPTRVTVGASMTHVQHCKHRENSKPTLTLRLRDGMCYGLACDLQSTAASGKTYCLHDTDVPELDLASGLLLQISQKKAHVNVSWLTASALCCCSGGGLWPLVVAGQRVGKQTIQAVPGHLVLLVSGEHVSQCQGWLKREVLTQQDWQYLVQWQLCRHAGQHSPHSSSSIVLRRCIVTVLYQWM